ncbi:putative membrane protein [Clostridium bornimense]|uniref:Putative membrane protein n=1 Tax=Clostridium bornimense TaxID=1216932 RepID=W6RZ12_9CLOT|nr:hypothetical protein [Clostridium bornimense]CDM69713.1 putative membrane protein [Clostridium bornimense]
MRSIALTVDVVWLKLLYILFALLELAYGYLIMEKIEELSNDQVRLASETLIELLFNLNINCKKKNIKK